jgi:hypothetical protein
VEIFGHKGNWVENMRVKVKENVISKTGRIELECGREYDVVRKSTFFGHPVYFIYLEHYKEDIGFSKTLFENC